jgi:hypothetical protein
MTDSDLQSIIRQERHRRARGACLLVEDWEESEAAEEAAKAELIDRYSMGTAGQDY